MRIRRPSRGTRWLAAAVGLGVAVTAVLVSGPAGAATTVSAQLALSGVVTDKSPTGGSVVGIHPGDSVDFKAAPAGVSTQGLNSLGIPLGDLLGSLLGEVVGYQVVMHLPSSFPGGARDVKLGPCGGASDLKVSFPKSGTYNLTWSAKSVTVAPLLGTCSLNTLNLDGNELKQAGIALNASNQWIGKVVVATDPPPGGISIQLPAVSAAPSVPVVGQLPSAGLPGANLPTLPVSGPQANPPLGGTTPTASSNSGSQPGSGLNYTPPGESVEDKTVPKGYGCCDEGSNPGGARADNVLLGQLGGRANGAPNDSPARAAGNGQYGTPVPTASGQPINLAARNKSPEAQMPVVLAILAIIALSLVTATYSRLYLLRRHTR